MTHLVIGLGEVGTALANVLSEVHEVSVLDANDKRTHIDNGTHFDMAHICFPYSDEFEPQVQHYQRTYDLDVTVIHSTVPVGTSRRLGAVHSPVMGRHPHLEVDLQMITKFIGGPLVQCAPVAHAFRAAGIPIYICSSSEATELCKLLSTLYFGVCVEFAKDAARLCSESGVPFEAWTLWNQAYNDAAHIIGNGMQRPNIVPIAGRIGGHCVLENADLIDSEFAELVKRRNE